MGGLKSNIAKCSVIFWFGFLTYLVFGGTLAFLLTELGYVGAFCNDPPISDPTSYENCKPCDLYESIFGVIEIGNCSNPILEFLATVFIIIPRVLIIVMAMLLYVFVEPLAAIYEQLPVIFFTTLIICPVCYVTYSTLYKNKNRVRFLHRMLLLDLMSLGAHLALVF